jgi:Bacterial regulatory proteins, luxR family
VRLDQFLRPLRPGRVVGKGSEGTVRNYLSAAIRKLGVRNRSEAIDLAVDQG